MTVGKFEMSENASASTWDDSPENIKRICSEEALQNGSFVYDNSTCNYEDPAITRMKEILTLMFTSINIVIAVGIVIGNSLVLTAFIKFKFVRTVHNALLLNMSMADFFTAPGIVLANVLGNFFRRSENTKVLCVSTAWLIAICFEGQICMLLLVTINRWISIRYPLRHHILFSKKKTIIITLSVWMLLFSLDTGCMIPNRWEPGTKCYPYRVAHSLCFKILVYPLILPPLFAMPVLYIMLTRYAYLHNKKMKKHVQTTTDPELRGRSQEIKTLKTLGIILGILYLSWLPNFILSFVLSINPTTYYLALAQKLFKNIATSCLYLGSLFNPLVYHRSSPTFRKAFLLIFNRKSSKRKKKGQYNNMSGRRSIGTSSEQKSSSSTGSKSTQIVDSSDL